MGDTKVARITSNFDNNKLIISFEKTRGYQTMSDRVIDTSRPYTNLKETLLWIMDNQLDHFLQGASYLDSRLLQDLLARDHEYLHFNFHHRMCPCGYAKTQKMPESNACKYCATNIPKDALARTCSGSVRCRKCGGKGSLPCSDHCTTDQMDEKNTDCNKCDGQGVVQCRHWACCIECTRMTRKTYIFNRGRSCHPIGLAWEDGVSNMRGKVILTKVENQGCLRQGIVPGSQILSVNDLHMGGKKALTQASVHQEIRESLTVYIQPITITFGVRQEVASGLGN